MAIFKRGLMPRWFGVLSVIVALGGISGVVSIVSAGRGAAIAVGFVLLLLSVLVASLIMLRNPTSDDRAACPHA